MKKKILSILSICALAMVCVGVENIQPTQATAEETIIYVASNGSDENAGTSDSPYATLEKALSVVEDGGTITLKDTVALGEWTAHGKSVTITGGGLDVSGVPTSTDSTDKQLKEVVINDSVTFTNVAWTVDSTLDTYIYANGNKTVIGEGVTYSQDKIRLFGGGKENTTVASTNLTVLSGTYNYIYGGSLRSTVTGDTNLIVGGTTNDTSAVDTAIKNHSTNYYVFGGGHVDKVNGSTSVVFQDSAKAVFLYGGSYGWGSKIAKGANVKVSGGTLMSVFGGTKGADSGSSTYTYIEGGHIQQVFGGNEDFTLTGNSDLRIVGGTITRRIYAGCYGDGKQNYLVSGKVNLELGGNVNITLNENHDDKGIYGRSRYKGDAEDCQIVFSSQAAYDNYKNKLGGSDWGATYVMGSTPAADAYHYYTYTNSNNTITQKCAYHADHTATATVALDNSVSLQYTGNAITPVKVSIEEAWEYDQPTVTYENNKNCGVASYTVTAGQETLTGQFVIVEAPVVLGGSVRLVEAGALRFQSKIPTELKNSGAEFGTLIIPKAVLGENELTVNLSDADNIKQTKWATEAVKLNNPGQYEEGYEYFNAVLTEIPEKYYDTVIVARSYVYANGQYYYSAPMERSIAQVSACALKDGYTNDILYTHVDKALENSTVTMQKAVTLQENESYQLTLSGNKGYVAIWSTDSDIISVDSEGKITAGKVEGTAVVTAKIGNVTVQCTVTVQHNWTGYY